MNFKNKMIALGATVVVAGGLGVATVNAHADQGTVTAADAQTTKVAKVKPQASASSQKLAAKHAKAVAVKQQAAKKAAASSSAKASSQAQATSSAAKASSTSASSAAQASSQAASASAASVKTASSSVASSQASSASQAPARQTAAAPVATAQTPAQKAAAKAASIRATTGETYVGTISGAGHSTDVVQGSMSRTSAPAQAGLAMTWGGATRLSTTDGLTSEIAGHARSTTFAWVMSLGVGSTVSVTDASGNSRSYTVYATDDVNDDSYSVKNGKDQYNAITSAGQGEAVVLQTCISDTVNRIVWAH